MELEFIGCGDAFASGGRLNTCFHLRGARTNLLVDCGATSMVGLNRTAIDRNAIEAILITHFHGDHFAGLPFFVLDAQFHSKRRSPLIVAGPMGIEERWHQTAEACFEGSTNIARKFELHFVEIPERSPMMIAGTEVTAYPVDHGRSGGPFYAYRIRAGGRVLAYSGDTEWTDTLIEAAKDADLFICEAYFRDKQVQLHMDLATLELHLPVINARRVILTHMGPDMLARRHETTLDTAEDGMIVKF